MPPIDLSPLETICKRIALNIPDNCQWRWDREFNLALTIINRRDEIMVGLPLQLEFSHKWDFSSINDAEAPVREYFHGGFGVVPGQKVFTTDPVMGVVLFVAWWPWGDDERISLRVGLVSTNTDGIGEVDAKKLICSWLDIK